MLLMLNFNPCKNKILEIDICVCQGVFSDLLEQNYNALKEINGWSCGGNKLNIVGLLT